jgi:alkylation response protein AidB-like acyl-CoA dehydrogenase
MLQLTDDQQLLQETAERFIDDTCPLSAIREIVEGADLDGGYLNQAAELGWFAALVPEENGGGSVSGYGVVDTAVVAWERGRVLQPGPFIPTNVVADTIARSGSGAQKAEVLPQLVSAESTAAWAVADEANNWSGASGVTATRSGDGFILSGSKSMCQDADSAGWILVMAQGDEGPTNFLVPAGSAGVEVTRLDGLDLTRSFSRVTFTNAPAEASSVVGEIGGALDTFDRQMSLALTLTAAEMVGAMGNLFDMTVEYAKDRIAFGRPIGSFQAIKHILADTSLMLEASRGTVEMCARAVQKDGETATEEASITKAYVSDSAITLAQNCWQVFGGIAYTWEHDLHLYLRRLTFDAMLYGDAAWHRERICRFHGLENGGQS